MTAVYYAQGPPRSYSRTNIQFLHRKLANKIRANYSTHIFIIATISILELTIFTYIYNLYTHLADVVNAAEYECERACISIIIAMRNEIILMDFQKMTNECKRTKRAQQTIIHQIENNV